MDPNEAGEYLLRIMESRTGIELASADILDIGCGSRFPASIINRGIDVGSYTGIDVYKDMIDFLIKNTATHPKMHFAHWPVNNALYNPAEEQQIAETTLPVVGEFDLICFFSVFTHLAPKEASFMLRLSAGALRSKGRIFLSAFVSDTQKTDFIDQDPDKSLLRAMYRRDYLESLMKDAGLAIAGFYTPEKLIMHHYVLRHDEG